MIFITSSVCRLLTVYAYMSWKPNGLCGCGSQPLDRWHTTGSLAAMTVWSSEGLFGLYQLLKLITVQQLAFCLSLSVCRSSVLRSLLLQVFLWVCVCLYICLISSLLLCVFVSFCLTCLPSVSHPSSMSLCRFHWSVQAWQNSISNTQKNINFREIRGRFTYFNCGWSSPSDTKNNLPNVECKHPFRNKMWMQIMKHISNVYFFFLQIGDLKDHYHFFHSRTIKRSTLSSRGRHSFISMEPKVSLLLLLCLKVNVSRFALLSWVSYHHMTWVWWGTVTELSFFVTKEPASSGNKGCEVPLNALKVSESSATPGRWSHSHLFIWEYYIPFVSYCSALRTLSVQNYTMQDYPVDKIEHGIDMRRRQTVAPFILDLIFGKWENRESCCTCYSSTNMCSYISVAAAVTGFNLHIDPASLSLFVQTPELHTDYCRDTVFMRTGNASRDAVMSFVHRQLNSDKWGLSGYFSTPHTQQFQVLIWYVLLWR